MTGMVTITAAAEMAAVGCSKNDSPVKKASAAGTGRARSVAVSEMPKTKSFQAKKNTRIDAVATPGAARGAMNLRKACPGVAPSAGAARSIAHGISRKNAERVQMASGSVNDM